KDTAVRKEAVKRVNEIIDFASIFQVPVNIGKVRGDIHEELFIQSWHWMSGALNEVCEHADTVGVDIILEPQNKHNINNLNTTYETMNLIKELKLPNLQMMIDVFHLAFEDYSIEKSLSLVKDQLLHVHLADSNRFAPGMGDFDFTYTIQLLEDINYQGYLSLEVAAEKNRFKEAKDAAEFL
ncbi:sugar phosphate isomerase/epimerase, partial [Aeromonas veronii]|nr:sugar phosphate isomerase/epimerase [Aeromonas veronii]